MKLNLLQFITFAFMVGWVGTDVIGGATYDERLSLSLLMAAITAYSNNAHGILWGKLKGLVSKARS